MRHSQLHSPPGLHGATFLPRAETSELIHCLCMSFMCPWKGGFALLMVVLPYLGTHWLPPQQTSAWPQQACQVRVLMKVMLICEKDSRLC